MYVCAMHYTVFVKHIYVPNNECVPNTKDLRMSLYHSFIYGQCVDVSMNVNETS